MTSVIGILTGIVTLLGAAIPVYFKWRKLKRAEDEKIKIAGDSDLHGVVSKRVQDRIKIIRKGRDNGAEKEQHDI